MSHSHIYYNVFTKKWHLLPFCFAKMPNGKTIGAFSNGGSHFTFCLMTKANKVKIWISHVITCFMTITTYNWVMGRLHNRHNSRTTCIQIVLLLKSGGNIHLTWTGLPPALIAVSIFSSIFLFYSKPTNVAGSTNGVASRYKRITISKILNLLTWMSTGIWGRGGIHT